MPPHMDHMFVVYFYHHLMGDCFFPSNILLSRQTESVRDHKFHSGMLIHRWFTDRGHFISHLHQTQEQTEGEWCISVSVLFANTFRNEAMSVSSERNEVAVCPLFQF